MWPRNWLRRLTWWRQSSRKNATVSTARGSRQQAPEVPSHTWSGIIVLLDLQNLRGDEPQHVMGRSWSVLRRAIARECGHKPLYRAYAFRRANIETVESREHLVKAIEAWKEHGYEYLSHPTKDSDMIMAAELTYWLTELLERHEHVSLTLVIGSGDGDFAPFINNARHVYRDRLTLIVKVFTWSSRLSWKLRDAAGEENIRYLDNEKGFTNSTRTTTSVTL